MKKIGVFFLLLINLNTEVSAGNDTLLLSYNDFMQQVKLFHPLSRRAQLLDEQAESAMQFARGNFDPVISGQVSQKTYQDNLYYRRVDAGLVLPFRAPVTANAGFIRNDGNYLNPENNTPQNGLFFAGAEINLGKGLFIDERRLALQQAEIFSSQNKIQQRLMMNELLFQSSVAYWNWYRLFQRYALLEEVVVRAENRYEFVRMQAETEERALLDTLEAGIILQQRKADKIKTEMELMKAKNEVAVFLWDESGFPLELTDRVVPLHLSSEQKKNEKKQTLQEIDSLIAAHPELILYNLKLDELKLNQKWNREKLKPEAKLKYNLISGVNNQLWNADVLVENYQFGAVFGFPVFLRKERATIRLNEIRMEQTALDTDFKKAVIRQKVNTAILQVDKSEDLVTLLERNVQAYTALLQAEYTLFSLGESTLFVLNSRENAFIDANVKYIDAQMENKYYEADLQFLLMNFY